MATLSPAATSTAVTFPGIGASMSPSWTPCEAPVPRDVRARTTAALLESTSPPASANIRIADFPSQSEIGDALEVDHPRQQNHIRVHASAFSRKPRWSKFCRRYCKMPHSTAVRNQIRDLRTGSGSAAAICAARFTGSRSRRCKLFGCNEACSRFAASRNLRSEQGSTGSRVCLDRPNSECSTSMLTVLDCVRRVLR